MTVQVRDILLSAIALIERGWSQKSAAWRADGSHCGPADDDAAAWCLTAALYRREDYRVFPADAIEAEKLVRGVIGLRDPFMGPDGKLVFEGTRDWNDHPKRTKDDVLGALRQAALHTAFAEGKPAP